LTLSLPRKRRQRKKRSAQSLPPIPVSDTPASAVDHARGGTYLGNDKLPPELVPVRTATPVSASSAFQEPDITFESRQKFVSKFFRAMCGVSLAANQCGIHFETRDPPKFFTFSNNFNSRTTLHASSQPPHTDWTPLWVTAREREGNQTRPARNHVPSRIWKDDRATASKIEGVEPQHPYVSSHMSQCHEQRRAK
jgi:hypothetical protein